MCGISYIQLINLKTYQMDQIKFSVTFHRKKYDIYIERGLHHRFKNKFEVTKFIKKYKLAVHDSVIIMGNLFAQLHAIRQLWLPYYNVETKLALREHVKDFEDQYFMIYNNKGSNGGSYVQFNKIRVCFDVLLDMINTMKIDAQKNKRSVVLNNIYAIDKMYGLVLQNYVSEINGLTNGVQYRSEAIKLKRFNEKPIPKTVSSRKLSDSK